MTKSITMDLGMGDVHIDGAVKVQKKRKTKLAEPKPKAKRLGGRGKGLRMRIHADGNIDVRHLSDGPVQCDGVELVAMSDQPAKPVWIQVAKSGVFRGHPAGPFEMNSAIFGEVIRNFKKDGQDIPVDWEHASEAPATSGTIPVAGAPAQGWIKDLRIDGSDLYGLVDWLPLAREYIKSGQYKYFSPAIRFNSKDRVTGEPIGARMTSGALTNVPYLTQMKPMTASDKAMSNTSITMKYAHTSNEYMPRIRMALRLSDLSSARECSDAMGRLCAAYKAGGGDMHQGVDVPGYVSSMRDMMSAPMGTTVEEIFEAVQDMIDAAIEEHEATMHPGQEEAEDAEMSDKSPGEEDANVLAALSTAVESPTTLTDKGSNMDIRELEATNAVLLSDKTALTTEKAELSLKLTDAQAKLSTLEADLKTLSDWKAERLEADLTAEVDTAFMTYKDAKKLSDSDKANMVVLCKAAPEAFKAMFPRVAPDQRHLLRDLVKGDPSAKTAGDNVQTADTLAAKPLNLITLSDKLKAENPKLSSEEALIAAEKQIRAARSAR